MRRPLCLDLFCGAGGAAMGYYRAGYAVIGVDLAPQPRYPFRFHQGDALELLAELIAGRAVYGFLLDDLDLIHASPPCQHWSAMSNCKPGLAATYPALIAPVRALLRCTGLPYVIENVPGAPLVDPVTLCGSSFGLAVRRHRLFESCWPLYAPPCDHKGYAMNPHNAAGRARMRRLAPGRPIERTWREAMGVGWMGAHEGREAIPPAYTEHIGRQLNRAAQLREAA